MSSDKLKEKVVEYIKKHCKADDYIFSFEQKNAHETRFAQNMITQHMGGTFYTLMLDVAYGNKMGTAVVNQPDDEHLAYLIETAQQMAKLNQPDPEHVPSQEAIKLADFENHADSTAELTTDDMVSVVERCVENAVSKEAKVSGMTSRYLHDSMMVTKNGFLGENRSSIFEHSMTMKRDDVETKVASGTKDFAQFSVEREIERLNGQFSALAKPRPIEAGRYPVILRSPAASGYFHFLNYMMDLRRADEGTSPFSGQIGKQFFGKDFTMRSTFTDPELLAYLYNQEGAPAKEIYWVRNGVLENLPSSRYYASKKGVDPCFTFNTLIEGGDATEAEMMKKVGKGIIINHLWYIRFVDAKRGELTGMTRDGVLWFEDGEIKHPIVNLRFNEVVNEVTQRILALGESTLQIGYRKVPTMLIDDFNFVDTTSF